MKSHKMLAVIVLGTVTVLTGCATEPTATERNFGDSVRQMIEAQTYDPSTIANPSTEPVEGADGQRARNVLEAYRTDVSKPETANEGVVISVDEGR